MCTVFPFYLIGYLFLVATILVKTERNDTTSNVEDRGSLFSPFVRSKNSCVTKHRAIGRCVPLRACPDLSRLAARTEPIYLLQAVSDYTCGLTAGGIHVCCPDFEDNETQKPWEISSSSAVLSNPNEEPWRKIHKTTSPSPQTSSDQNEKNNRRLLPESYCGVHAENKILNGKKTLLEEYPWMARLQIRVGAFNKQFSCGGSLITLRYVLTAAHCIKGKTIPINAKIDLVRLGEYNENEELDCVDGMCSLPHDDVFVESVTVHPKFKRFDDASHYDIALVRLTRPAKLSAYVQPICLPLDEWGTADYDGKELWTAGWGSTKNERNSHSPIKLKVNLPFVPFEKCKAIYSAMGLSLTQSQMCAGGEVGSDSCSGDSGGPLMYQGEGAKVRWYVAGIVSTGPKLCGTAGKPGIYTNVAKFMDWILDNIHE